MAHEEQGLMNGLELETVTDRLRQNRDDFSWLDVQLNPGYEVQDVDLLTAAVLANNTLKGVDFFGILSEDPVNEAAQRLVESFATLPNLRTLNVSGYCHDLMATLGRILAQRSSLHTLTLRYVNLEGGLDVFYEALRRHTGLVSFQLIDCETSVHLRDDNILRSILDNLCDKPSLEGLEISAFNPSSLGNLPVDSLARLCRGSPNLRKLHVYSILVDDESGPYLTPVTEALEHSRSIQDLRLPASPLQKHHWMAMARLVEATNSLRCFQIDCSHDPKDDNEEENDDDSEHILEFAKSLRYNSSLHDLRIHPRLPSDMLSPTNRNSFGKHLETNYALRVVEPNSPHSDMYTMLNRQGRGELIQNESSSREEWILKLIQVRRELNSVYYFISINPSLCDSS